MTGGQSNYLKNPPQFSMKKSYEVYKTELEIWTKATDVKPGKWGYLVALSLPNEQENPIRDKVMTQLKDKLGPGPTVDGQEGDQEAGYKEIVKWLDEEFKQEKNTNLCSKIDSFMSVKRKEQETVKDFISNFDQAYIEAINSGLTELPDVYLLWQLLKNCGLSDHEYRLVQTKMTTPRRMSYTSKERRVSRFSLMDQESNLTCQLLTSVKMKELHVLTLKFCSTQGISTQRRRKASKHQEEERIYHL